MISIYNQNIINMNMDYKKNIDYKYIMKSFTDDDIFEKLSFLNPYFKNIHPNYITLFGLVLNFIIFEQIKKGNINTANFLLILRCLADIFDGKVARLYNKQSSVGGLLDTISDNIIAAIMVYIYTEYFTNDKKISFNITLIFILICAYYVNINNSVVDHNNLKTVSDNDNSIPLFVYLTNRTYIIFSFFILFNIYFLKK
jgi:phosphatidylserine synthase